MNKFEKNSRVCFIGDSITHNNEYVSYIADYYHSNFLQENVNFYNCGVSGGTTATALINLADDVMLHNPTHAVILLGTNDCCCFLLHNKSSHTRYLEIKNMFNTFQNNYKKLCEKLSSKSIKIILCTPLPIDEYADFDSKTFSGGYALMMGYAQYIRAYAINNGYELCDYNEYFIEQMQKDSLFQEDRIHPNKLGQYHIARCFINSQGYDLGEYYELPEYMNKWRKKVNALRNIRSIEHLIINDYTLNTMQRIDKVKTMLENDSIDMPPSTEIIIDMAKDYLKNKPQQSELQSDSDRIMEVCFKNKI